MEAGYDGDGWLGPLCNNIRRYDFSGDDKTFEEEWKQLHTMLKSVLNR